MATASWNLVRGNLAHGDNQQCVASLGGALLKTLVGPTKQKPLATPITTMGWDDYAAAERYVPKSQAGVGRRLFSWLKRG